MSSAFLPVVTGTLICRRKEGHEQEEKHEQAANEERNKKNKEGEKKIEVAARVLYLI